MDNIEIESFCEQLKQARIRLAPNMSRNEFTNIVKGIENAPSYAHIRAMENPNDIPSIKFKYIIKWCEILKVKLDLNIK